MDLILSEIFTWAKRMDWELLHHNSKLTKVNGKIIVSTVEEYIETIRIMRDTKESSRMISGAGKAT